jgi:hypothetical protein
MKQSPILTLLMILQEWMKMQNPDAIAKLLSINTT